MTEAMNEAANRPKFSIMTVSNAIEGGYDAVLKECGAGINDETKKALLAYNHYLRAVLIFERKPPA